MKEIIDFKSKARRIFAENGLSELISEQHIEKFEQLTEIMQEVGKTMNLTAIKDVDEIIAKHYADSLMAADTKIIPIGASVIDVGCGAGFPSFPIAILRPDLKITGVDSTAKKINYVNETAIALELSNLSAHSARAEDECGEKGEAREKYDVVCARAVASLPVLCELCLPYIKVGGRFVALKARSAGEELEAAASAIKILGGKLNSVVEKELSFNGETEKRNIIIIDKVAKTPSLYPRQYSKISSKPL